MANLPNVTAEILAEMQRQDAAIRELSPKLVDLLAGVDSPVGIACMLDMIITIAAATPQARTPVASRLRMLAAVIDAMPDGVPTFEAMQAFLAKANAAVGAVKTPEADKPTIVLPPGTLH